MDINEINSAIMHGDFTNAELNSIASAIQYARVQLTRQKVRSFSPGDTVKFTSNRNGMTYTGTVEKVKIKYVLVRTGSSRFNVPANMLEAAQ